MHGIVAFNGGFENNGAGDGNRTHATGLEGQGSAIELHPQYMICILFRTSFIITLFIKRCKYYRSMPFG